MANLSVTLPGGSGLIATAKDLAGAASEASELVRDLTAAQYASAAAAEGKIEDCQLGVIKIGHVLGLTFQHVKRFSGEIAMQRMELQMDAATRKFAANMAARASAADVWKHRALTAEAKVRDQIEELERLRAEAQPALLVAAE